MQIQIRRHNQEADKELTEFVERRLRFSLGRFSGRLRFIVVSLDDLNGPRGGVDQECRITVHTAWGVEIVIAERGSDSFAAAARAAERAGRSVRRQISLRLSSFNHRPAEFTFGD